MASVNRSIDQPVPGETATITISWNLSDLSGAVILQEVLPTGWILADAPTVDPANASWRLQGQLLEVAVGLGQSPPVNGSIQYTLYPPADGIDASLRFSGRMQSLVTEQLQYAGVGGDASLTNPVPEEESSGPAVTSLWVTGVVATDGQGARLSFAVETEAVDSASPARASLSTHSGEPVQGVVYVEYTPSLLDPDLWRVIHTSAPADRVASPGRIDWSLPPEPGAIRLRWEPAP